MEQSTLKQPASAEPPNAGLVPSGNGSTLYVINLCASMAPIANSDKALPGFEQYRVYQVSRKEDGRIRYRLRLGFFTDEAEADTALACIREQYPTAFAASLSDEDQRHTRGFAGNSKSTGTVSAAAAVSVVQKTPAVSSQAAPTPSNAAPLGNTPPPAKAAAAQSLSSAPSPIKPAAASASDTQRVATLKVDPPVQSKAERAPAPRVAAAPSEPVAPATNSEARPTQQPTVALTLASEPVAQRASVPSTPTNEPFHVGKGVEIPTSTLSLEPEPAAAKPQSPAKADKPAAAAGPATRASVSAPQPAVSTRDKQPTAATVVKDKAVARPAVPAASVIKKPAPPLTAMPTPTALKPPVVLGDDQPLPDFDSTQTIRALTAAELDDESQPKWFAVQLAVSEQPINLDTMPHLDIFSAYRLYSVATAGGGKIMHHMRIGFFKEKVSAEAVSGYLRTFFADPTVLRISAAEQTRFAEAPQRIAPPEAKAKVIDMAAARGRTPPQEIPVVTMEVTPNPGASGRHPKPNTGLSDRYAKPDTSASGVYRSPPAAKTAARSATAARSSKPGGASNSGKHRTLNEALLAEAREVALSESAIRRLPKNSSLLSKLFGKK